MKNISWPGVCADPFLSRQHWKEGIGVLQPLLEVSEDPRTNFLSEVGRGQLCPIKEPGAELRGRPWGESHALLSFSSRAQFSTGCTLNELHWF